MRMGFGMGFGFFNVMFFVIFILVLCVVIAAIVQGIGQWNKNNHSPRLTVVGKRMDVTHHSHANAGDISGAHGYHSTSSTYYYVTFQVESKDRIELQVDGSEYGVLVEGDIGKLSFQGTRYLGFVRMR